MCQFKSIFLKPCSVKLYSKDLKYDMLRVSSNKRCFFRVNFLINATFEHLRMRRLLGATFISLFTSILQRLLEGGEAKNRTKSSQKSIFVKKC